uniref:Uncharacterized protein n=1 Tax=Caenorhabditis japonica TaxID=281687 RepID=A0A8R1IKV1_CAEJA
MSHEVRFTAEVHQKHHGTRLVLCVEFHRSRDDNFVDTARTGRLEHDASFHELRVEVQEYFVNDSRWSEDRMVEDFEDFSDHLKRKLTWYS